MIHLLKCLFFVYILCNFVYFRTVHYVIMASKQKHICKQCGYEAEVYSGYGFFKQRISQVVCCECRTIQNLTVGGIIAEVAPSFGSEFGRLCPKCMSDDIKVWDGKTCPKCQGEMQPKGEEEFWC